MYEITVKADFSGAHRVLNWTGKLEELHGHNWVVETRVASDELRQNEMVMDFTILKKYLHQILEDFDHKFLNDLDDFRDKNPTAENIASTIFRKLKALIGEHRLQSVTVYETETSSATYSEE